VAWFFYWHFTLFRLIAGCFDRWLTEKRQEEEEGLENTIFLKKEEGQEEGRGLNSLTKQPAASLSETAPIKPNFTLHDELSERICPPRCSAQHFIVTKPSATTFLTRLNREISWWNRNWNDKPPQSSSPFCSPSLLLRF
jgi:hypothetical protein